MKGTPTQLTFRGALHGYPRSTLLSSPDVLAQDMDLPNYIDRLTSQSVENFKHPDRCFGSNSPVRGDPHRYGDKLPALILELLTSTEYSDRQLEKAR